jgi:phage terminase small subunit
VDWSEGLTEKQVAFVEHYARYRNATQAYTHAYDTNGTYETRRDEGGKLMRDSRIQAAIHARIREGVQATGTDIGWLLGRFLDIATADPRELIGLKVGCCRYCHGDDHGYQWREREYLEACGSVEQENAALRSVHRPATVPYPDPAGGFGFNATLPPVPDCPQCHGEGVERFVPRDTDKLSDQALLLYGGVKVKRDGYEIIIASREKAMEMVGKIMGAFTEKVQHSGAIGALVATADLRNMDPKDAARAYREMVAGHLAAS